MDADVASASDNNLTPNDVTNSASEEDDADFRLGQMTRFRDWPWPAPVPEELFSFGRCRQ